MTFKELNLIDPILKALDTEGYLAPSPIQEQSIPVLLEGKDILGSAQTGTGKTAAFAIPIIQGLYLAHNAGLVTKKIQALILAPTRELASQIKDSFSSYGRYVKIKTTVIFGGVRQKAQTEALAKGVDILIATPGRLLDLINQGFIDLSQVKFFVLDEADRMLDMGFIHDVNKIVKLIPSKRQTMLFSATMPKEIAELANAILKDPVRVAVTPVEATLDIIKQSLYLVSKKDKIDLLAHLITAHQIPSALVFTRTKHGANKVVKDLNQLGIMSEAIHGNKSQNAREIALKNFKTKKTSVLIATDIAARGIDIDELSHVINYDLPEVPETYIHRIGRTGRAGLSGTAISFCSPDESGLLKDIEKHILMKIPQVADPLLARIQMKNKLETKNKTNKKDKENMNNPNKFDQVEETTEKKETTGQNQKQETKPTVERPQGERPARPAYDRPQSDRPARPSYDRPQGSSSDSRPARPAYDRPQGERPARPAYDRPQGERPARPSYDKPQGSSSDSRPARPAYDRPQGERPARPAYDRPQGERPARPSYDKPQGSSSDSRPARPAYDRPQGDRPARPAYDRPQGDRPARPAYDRPRTPGSTGTGSRAPYDKFPKSDSNRSYQKYDGDGRPQKREPYVKVVKPEVDPVKIKTDAKKWGTPSDENKSKKKDDLRKAIKNDDEGSSYFDFPKNKSKSGSSIKKERY
jgi:ATP-dependent RNA helicase RhlE